MLTRLGKTVEQRPWFIIGIVLLVTIGMGSLVPAIEMETSTEDFMPDDEIVNANERVSEYFGQSGELMMAFVEKQNAQNVITPQALREANDIANELQEMDGISYVTSVAGFVDIVCGLEYNQSLENCSDLQIETALQDLLINENTEVLTLLENDDAAEQNAGGVKPSVDLKNAVLRKTNDSYIFEIEVYDLSQVESEHATDGSAVNVTEWFVGFDNAINPFFPFDIHVSVSARMAVFTEVERPKWDFGRGPLRNIRVIQEIMESPQIDISYTLDPYVTLSLSDGMAVSLALEESFASFDFDQDLVIIEIPISELEQFGVAPRFGSFELPGKLVNFSVGVQYYQIPTAMYHLTKRFELIQQSLVMNIFMSGDIDSFSDMGEGYSNASFDMGDSFGFAGQWITIDTAPDTGTSSEFFFIRPLFFDDLKSAALAFLSTDYDESSGPSKTLMLISLETDAGAMGFDETNVGLEALSKNIQKEVGALDVEASTVSMRVTGNGIISYEMNESTAEANAIIMPSIFVVICLILLVMFKRISYVVLPLASLGISIIWLFGTMALLDISFNMMMVAIVPLLMGLGVDYSVHLFHNYKSELNTGKSPGSAIIASIEDVGMAILLATLTTVIAFLSFLTAGIPPLRDFGLLCAFGIIYTLVTALTFQTAVRYLLDRKKSKGLVSKKNNTISLDGSMGWISDFILRRRKIIYLLTIFVTVFMASGAAQVDTTFDMNDFLPEGNQALAIFVDIEQYFPSASEAQEYILIEGSVASVATLRGIAATYENLRDDTYVTKTPSGDPKQESIYSIMQTALRDNSTLASRFSVDSSGIPISDEMVVAFYDYLYDHGEYWMDVRGVLHREKKTYDATIIRVYTSGSFSESDEESTQASEVLYQDLVDDMTSYGDAKAIVTGGTSSINSIMSSMTESQLWSTFISVVLAALILMIVFRNILLGMVATIPVAVSIVWIVGSIHFMGYSFNVMTVMVTSLNIGIGIAFGIHVIQRFRLTADRSGDVRGAVAKTVTHTGGALFIAALTTAAGFGMLILAPIPPEQQFGIITAMTIIYSYVTSIFVLPPILMRWGEWRKQRKGFIISPNGVFEK